MPRQICGARAGLATATLTSGEKESLEVTLPGGRTIRGRVVDGDTGEPIPGAEVKENRWRQKVAIADDAGAFEFPGWMDDRMDILSATAEGYPWVSRRVRDEEEIQFTLVRGDEVTGRVVDPDGRPVAGVLVKAWASIRSDFRSGDPTRDASTLDAVSAETDPEGRFVLSTVRTEDAHTLAILKPGHGGLRLTFDHSLAVGDRIDLGDIVLQASGSLAGRALDGSGEPLAGVTIRLGYPSLQRDALPGGLKMGSKYHTSERRRTDDIGRFRFTGLPAGKYRVSVEPGNSPRVGQRVSIGPGEHVGGIVLRGDAGRSVTVRLEAGSGEPINDVEVELTVREGLSLRYPTDSDGTVIFRDLPEVPVSITPLGGEGFIKTRSESVTPADQEVRFVLQRRAAIEGTVLAPDGTPLRGMEIRYSYPGQTSRYTIPFSGRDGTFRFSVPTGTVVDIEIPGRRDPDPSHAVGRSASSPYRGEAREIEAPAMDVRILTRRVDYNRALHVLLLDWDGKPMPDMRIHVGNSAGSAGSAETGPDGRVSFEGLPAEEVLISVTNRWNKNLPQKILDRLPPPPPEDVIFPWIRVIPRGQEITLRFERGVMIRGTTMNPQGEPERSVSVFIYSEIDGGRLGRTSSDRDGHFKLPVPRDHPFRIEAYRHLMDQSLMKAVIDGLRGPIEDLAIQLSWSE